jgi:spermidine/putrescine transport system ATP-binding protein
MSDTIAVMKDGEIVQLGAGEEIYRDPVSRYVADFIGEANLIDCVAEADGSVRLVPGGVAFPYSSAVVGTATLMVRPEDIRVGETGGDGGAVSIHGKVRDKVFIGQSWRIFAVLETGQEITVQPGSSHEAERLTPGAMAALWWPRERGRILAR